jgi:hypothetical protein
MTLEQAHDTLNRYSINFEKSYDKLPNNIRFIGEDEMNYSRIHSIKQPMSGLRETYCNALDALNGSNDSPIITIYSYEPIFSYSIRDNGIGMSRDEIVNNLLSFQANNQDVDNYGTFSQGFKQSLSFSKITYVESIKDHKKS